MEVGWLLALSRLFYNLHVWPTFGGKPRTIINAMYMRLLRGIMQRHRYGQDDCWSDLAVRTALQDGQLRHGGAEDAVEVPEDLDIST